MAICLPHCLRSLIKNQIKTRSKNSLYFIFHWSMEINKFIAFWQSDEIYPYLQNQCPENYE